MTRSVTDVQFLPSASAEAEDAVRWYEERRTGLGADFISALADAVAFATAWPETSPMVRHVHGTAVRRAAISGFPYGLVYYQRGDVLRVVALAHDRRKPRYWAARIGSE